MTPNNQKIFLDEYFKLCKKYNVRFEIDNGRMVLGSIHEEEKIEQNFPVRKEKEPVREIKNTKRKYQHYKPKTEENSGNDKKQ